jgi:hypothetical protein
MVDNPVGSGGIPGKYDYSVKTGLELYNLETDPSETTNVISSQPEVMDKVQQLADEMRYELGDSSTGVTGIHNREAGQVEAKLENKASK